MSDQDHDGGENDQADAGGAGRPHAMDGNYAAGATSTAGHGSTLGNEGNVGRTGYYNSTEGLEGQKGAHNTSATQGAETSGRYGELTGAQDDAADGAWAQGGGADPSDTGGPGEAVAMGTGQTLPVPEGTGAVPYSDTGEAARAEYSGHGTYSGGGSNDPNAQENPPAEQGGLGPGTFSTDEEGPESTPGTPKGGQSEEREDIGPGRYGGEAGGASGDAGAASGADAVDVESGAGSEHEMRDGSSDAETGSGQTTGTWQGGSASMHSMSASEERWGQSGGQTGGEGL